MTRALSRLPFQNGATEAELPFHSSLIGNFIFYQDRIEINLLQLFAHPENSGRFSTSFVITFEVNIVAEQK